MIDLALWQKQQFKRQIAADAASHQRNLKTAENVREFLDDAWKNQIKQNK